MGAWFPLEASNNVNSTPSNAQQHLVAGTGVPISVGAEGSRPCVFGQGLMTRNTRQQRAPIDRLSHDAIEGGGDESAPQCVGASGAGDGAADVIWEGSWEPC